MGGRRLPLLVVDGYNVIYKTSRYLDLMEETGTGFDDDDPFGRARERLVADVAAYAQGTYEPVIVFDAAGNVSSERPELTRAGVRLVFSPTGETADTVIERIVSNARRDARDVTVITSDNTIRATVGGIPVTRLSSSVLIDDVESLAEDAVAANAERNHVSLTLEGRLSPESRRRLWELIGKWGSRPSRKSARAGRMSQVAGMAQWQSNGFVNRGLGVRLPLPAPDKNSLSPADMERGFLFHG